MTLRLSTLQVVRSMSPEAGGMTESVGQLALTLGYLGHPTEIATVEPGGYLAWDGATPMHVFPTGSPARLRRSSAFRSFVLREAGRFNLIHVHGIWSWTGRYARIAAQKHQIPLVISPRGTIEEWTLRQKWFRKKVGWLGWERRNFQTASLFHATCEQEAESIRRLGFQTPIAVIPNGVAYPPGDLEPTSGERRHILFLSRLHPKKGLDLLVEAWGGLWSQFSAWDLHIAGPDEDGYGAAMALRANQLGIPHDRIRFIEPQYGPSKWAFYRQGDLLVLPSHSENFGNVIAEALSQGIPVLTTHGTPWQILETEDCGWWIPVGLDPLKDALAKAMTTGPTQLRDMGLRGRTLVEARYGWGGVTEAMARCYRWMLNPTDPPPTEILKGT